MLNELEAFTLQSSNLKILINYHARFRYEYDTFNLSVKQPLYKNAESYFKIFLTAGCVVRVFQKNKG